MTINAIETFRFEPGVNRVTSDSLAVTIPSGVTSKEELLHVLAIGLAIPHFGFNWDALEDSLRDLSWVSAYAVLIIHDELPHLAPTDLKNYLEILVSAAATWRLHAQEHSLLAVFPPTAYEAVVRLVGNYSPIT